jgi:hypothetical protein
VSAREEVVALCELKGGMVENCDGCLIRFRVGWMALYQHSRATWRGALEVY